MMGAKEKKKKRRENGRRENTFNGNGTSKKGREKNWLGPSAFSLNPSKCFLPNLERKPKRKLHASQIPDLPLSSQCVWLCLLFMHWITFTLCSFFLFNVLLFYFLNSYCIFIQSFKQLLLHFLAFCFSLFLINGGGIKWGAFTLFLLLFKKAPLIFLYK